MTNLHEMRKKEQSCAMKFVITEWCTSENLYFCLKYCTSWFQNSQCSSCLISLVETKLVSTIVCHTSSSLLKVVYVFVQVMKEHNCYQLVFSSSCTVYGNPESLPITEEHPTGNVTNVYGRTKYFIEEMLKDIIAADQVLHFAIKIKSLQKSKIFSPARCVTW